MRSTDPAVRTEPVDDMVKMAVDYAEQDHQALRRDGTMATAPTASPRRTIDAALQEQLQDKTVVPEPAKTATASRLARLAQSGQSSSGTSRIARLAQSGSVPSSQRPQNTGGTPSPRGGSRDSGDDRGIEF